MLQVAAVLVITLVAYLGYNRHAADNHMDELQRRLRIGDAGKAFDESMVASLPEAARKYFLHAIQPGTPLGSSVQLTSTGHFRLKPEGEWLPMTAEQVIASGKGFTWKASIGTGILRFSGGDFLDDNAAGMRFFMLGILPIVNAGGKNIARSATGRLAMEYVWLPSALLPHNGVTWESEGDNAAAATFQIGGESVKIHITVKENGSLNDVTCLRWSDKTKDGAWGFVMFGATVAHEGSFGGYAVPTAVTAGWRFNGNTRFEFFQAEIKNAEYR